MKHKPTPTAPTRDYRKEPTYWFAVMEIARERGQFERAAEAKKTLEQLGVKVSYKPKGAGK